jgi:hypothetical protein
MAVVLLARRSNDFGNGDIVHAAFGKETRRGV